MFRHSKSLIVFKANIDSLLKTTNVLTLRALSTDGSANGSADCVSASHSVSNLRLIKFGKRENESQTERDLRLRRIGLQDWNQDYWLKNNSEFKTQKSEYIENELKALKDREFKSALSYDELSVFYKRFLDQNHRKHMKYNLEWYKRHTSLLWPAFKAFLIRLKKR